MNGLPLHTPLLFGLLSLFVILSVFFSLAETALLSVNRYRIRHLVRHHHRLAKVVQQLLERPDRMLGVILFCDTFADILASAIATMLALHYWGESGVLWATMALTFVVLIFGEIAPKTLATIYPQSIALAAAWPVTILLKILYPIVWAVNGLANGVLRVFGVHVRGKMIEHFTREELRTVVHEAGGRLSGDYQAMLLRVLDLEKATVEDIMIPRNDMVGIDIAGDWENVLSQIVNCQHNRLPIYHEKIDQVIGILYLRKALNLLGKEKLTKKSLLAALDNVYFIPEGTRLNTQLINFKQEKCRMGIVVNEYGDIQGLVTLEDILEEIVGEFTTDMTQLKVRIVHTKSDNSYLVDGSVSVRELNKKLQIHLPTTGPKTLSGLIIEHLESIPATGVSLKIGEQKMEIVQMKGNKIEAVRLFR